MQGASMPSVGSPRNRCATAVLSLLLVAHCAAGEAWWEEVDSVHPEGISQILHGDLAGWTMQGYRGGTKQCAVETVGSRRVLVGKSRSLTLTRRTVYPPDTEIIVRFRFVPTDKAGAGVGIDAAVKNPHDRKERGVWFSASIRGRGHRMGWTLFDPRMHGQRKPFLRGSYSLNSLGARSLDWPERLRKLIEHEAASRPTIDKLWQTYRCVLRKEAYRVDFNGQTLVDRHEPGLDVSGMVRITMSPTVQLAQVRIRPFEPRHPRHETIPIGYNLNASQINGGVVSRDALPPAGKECLVNGIPFVFPEPDTDGRDHIDLGKSWFQAGYLEGHMQSRKGPCGGRWAAAFAGNPARIRFRIPPGRYRAIHLIAAADDEADSVPLVAAQFYRPLAGFPENFEAQVPLFSATPSDATPLPVRLNDGRNGNLYHVTIPVEPAALAAFKDMDYLAMELTKKVEVYRCYPDPSFYSQHQAGLPSSVRIYAMTMERPLLDIDLEPSKFANVWTAPARPEYTVALRNRTSRALRAELELTTGSHDQQEKTVQRKTVAVRPNGTASAKFTLALKKHGYHDVELRAKCDGQSWMAGRTSLAHLHQDTRERGRWELGRGPVFGYWRWGGSHNTPNALQELHVMAAAGAGSRNRNLSRGTDEEKAFAEKMGMKTHFLSWPSGQHATKHFKRGWDASKLEDMKTHLIEYIERYATPDSAINKQELEFVFGEPNIGHFTYGNLPRYAGEPEYQMNERERTKYTKYLEQFLFCATTIRERWPHIKILLPWGDPLFCVPFLRNSREARELIDGVGIDLGYYERLPEQQLHQCSLHRIWQLHQEWKKCGKAQPPILMTCEGPAIAGAVPGALTMDEQANHTVRCALLLTAYDVPRQLGFPAPFRCGDYWGECHYGGGLIGRRPKLNPLVAYSAYATLTRQLNGMNYRKWLPTGSLATYCLQYQHYQRKSLLHVFWTIRGKRAVAIDVPKGAKVRCHDLMDNEAILAEKNGKVTVTVTPAPCFVWGLTNDAAVTLGESDHSDSEPTAIAKRLGNLGDGSWELSPQPDEDYGQSHPQFIYRVVGKMSIRTVPAPQNRGGKALAVHLEKPERERKLYPWYTTLVAEPAVTIPGKARHLGLWVKAASDWGRVVYCLRDANGERWLSVGTRDEWNCDDPHHWSYFCFDGWRYLRFELPANAPYDTYREAGTVWWGAYGDGDRLVDLPLTLEKIIVERRTHAMYVNAPQPASAEDVLLGDLYAEYETPSDKTEDAVRQSRLRMRIPGGVPDLSNPIRDMATAGVGAPTSVTSITLPDQWQDGTRCYVHFGEVEGAKHYDVWGSPYEDGRGALCLGSKWTASGNLIRGLRPDTNFYVFVVYTDRDAKPSKPSKPLKIRLQDLFPNK